MAFLQRSVPRTPRLTRTHTSKPPALPDTVFDCVFDYPRLTVKCSNVRDPLDLDICQNPRHVIRINRGSEIFEFETRNIQRPVSITARICHFDSFVKKQNKNEPVMGCAWGKGRGVGEAWNLEVSDTINRGCLYLYVDRLFHLAYLSLRFPYLPPPPLPPPGITWSFTRISSKLQKRDITGRRIIV